MRVGGQRAGATGERPGAVHCRRLVGEQGHSLVIPRRHMADGMALHQPEWNTGVDLLKLWREELSAQDTTISG